MVATPKRHPNVPHARLALSEERAAIQKQRGLYVVERGEPFAVPVDRLSEPTVFLNRELWRESEHNGVRVVHRPGVQFTERTLPRVERFRQWLGKHHPELQYKLNLLTFGHDVHLTTRGNLYGRQWHRGWADPFTERMVGALKPEDVDAGAMGFLETLGWLSGGKVTTAFRDFEVAELVATGTYANVDFHEVGTNAAGEDNTHTALQTTSGITLVNGTPTDAAPIYRNVGTITADTTESWEEHGLFSAISGGTMMDRSLTLGQSVTSSDQVEYTYEITKAAEA